MNINRDKTLYSSRQEAYISIMISQATKGDFIIKEYREKGERDFLMAYAVSDCFGYPLSLDAIKFISLKNKMSVFGIKHGNKDENIDITNISKGETYIYIAWNDISNKEKGCKVYLIYSDLLGNKITKPFTNTLTEVYNMEDGNRYYISSNSFKEEGTHITKEDVISYTENLITSRLDSELSEIKNQQGSSSELLDEIEKNLFSLKLNFSLNTTTARIGDTVSVTLDYAVLYKNEDVTSNCKRIQLYVNELETIIPEDNIIRGLTSDTTFKLKIKYKDGYEIESDTLKLIFLNYIYYGVLKNSNTNYTELENQVLKEIKPDSSIILENINMDLEDSIFILYPKSFGKLSSISDGSLQYISDYSVSTIRLNYVDYYLYKKITPVDITKFKQIFTW